MFCKTFVLFRYFLLLVCLFLLFIYLFFITGMSCYVKLLSEEDQKHEQAQLPNCHHISTSVNYIPRLSYNHSIYSQVDITGKISSIPKPTNRLPIDYHLWLATYMYKSIGCFLADYRLYVGVHFSDS